mgnify:CR=1 FL=1
MGHRTEIHDKVLNAKSLRDITEAYGSWAKTYDQDLLENFGYQAPARSVELLSKYLLMEEAVVLDAGCGTGLVGQLLAKARKFQIDGADYSRTPLRQFEASKRRSHRRCCFRWSPVMDAGIHRPHLESYRFLWMGHHRALSILKSTADSRSRSRH